jgi:hypothetical protein
MLIDWRWRYQDYTSIMGGYKGMCNDFLQILLVLIQRNVLIVLCLW